MRKNLLQKIMDPSAKERCAPPPSPSPGRAPLPRPTPERGFARRATCSPRAPGPPCLGRVDRIAIVKPEKAKRLEDMIIQMANKGQLQSQVNDAMLKQMLEQISEGDAAAPSNTVKFDRRRFGDDSDSDIDLSDL